MFKCVISQLVCRLLHVSALFVCNGPAKLRPIGGLVNTVRLKVATTRPRSCFDTDLHVSGSFISQAFKAELAPNARILLNYSRRTNLKSVAWARRRLRANPLRFSLHEVFTRLQLSILAFLACTLLFTELIFIIALDSCEDSKILVSG